jgi:predicted N-acetyltransferase YhbS
MIVREERQADITAIRLLNGQAFGSDVEGNLMDLLRRNGYAALSMGAEERDSIVGQILYSPVTNSASEGESRYALGLGPMAVALTHQRRGIGTALVMTSLDELRRRGKNLLYWSAISSTIQDSDFEEGLNSRSGGMSIVPTKCTWCSSSCPDQPPGVVV